MDRVSRPAGDDPVTAFGDRVRRLTPGVLLIAVAGACWAITAERMQGMDIGPAHPAHLATDLGALGWFAGVWVTMMAAMMLPSLVPMAHTFAGASRRSGAAVPTATTFVFTLGFSRAGCSTWGGAPGVAGGVILAAALYELTPVKSKCLLHCRNTHLLTRRWRPGMPGAVAMGVEHGGFCVGSSWALMAVLFAVGVMT